MSVRLLVVGDVLLDTDIEGDVSRVCPDAPAPVVDITGVHERAGGAGLAATLLARDGIDVALATGLADDEPAKRLTALLSERLPVTAVLTSSGTRCKTRIRSSGQSIARLDTDPPSEMPGQFDEDALAEALDGVDAVLVSDYAGGVAGHPGVRSLLSRWARRVPMVWDPHPRSEPPVPGVTVATPNKAEARHFSGGSGPLDRLASRLRHDWDCVAVAVTDGENGVFTAAGDGPPLFNPAPARYRGDCCGAGDRFSGTVTARLASGDPVVDAVRAAVDDTTSWLYSGGVSGSVSCSAELDGIERVRASGGTVVATGGCFDVLHAGHVASLEAARRLGDALVVLVNSDDSVRRLKGPGRPVHRIEDRCRVLRSLRCVDAVEVFDEDDPAAALRRLRPDVWAKGGDYTPESLPEASVLDGWGGRVVLLPYLPGRSTTGILSHNQSNGKVR